MIDLHSHILPGVDDGPEDWDGALAMMALAEQAGTEILVATPHSHDFWRASEPAYLLVPRLVAEANVRARAAGLALEILIGQECHIGSDLVQELDEALWFTLGGSRTVLMELPFNMWPPFTDRLIFDLQMAGYTVLLAHPERYHAVNEDPDRLLPLVERGVFLQVTSSSIMGRFGERPKRTARQLVEAGLAHVLASDAHTTRGRPPTLDEAAREIAGWTDEETVERLTVTVPRALLDDRQPDVPEPRPVQPLKRRKRFGLF